MSNLIKKNIKIAIGTLGCRLNKFESDSIATDFINGGYELVSITEKADIYIINTCTVTNKSDAKSRNLIRKVNRINPQALIIVTGCYVDTDLKDIRKIEGVDCLIANNNKSKLYEIVNYSLNKNKLYNPNLVRNKDNNKLIIDNSYLEKFKGNNFDYTYAYKGMHSRSFIKIQDGCNMMCTYCKVPYARGKAISRPFNDILDNITFLYHQGFKEFVLTGINIIHYNYNTKTLEDLISAIYCIEGGFRIRLSSCEPHKISDKLIDLFKNKKMGQHIHIPLQSGSDRILKAMARKYDTNYYTKLIDKIRKNIPNINITTDIMVGFPGEKEEDFNNNVKIIKRCKFTHVHTFKYSKRNGTPAANMPEQVPEINKTIWSKKIRELSKKQNQEYQKKQIGKLFKVLVEDNKKNDYATGFTDNYIKVEIPNCYTSKLEFIIVKIKEVCKNKVIAETQKY